MSARMGQASLACVALLACRPPATPLEEVGCHGPECAEACREGARECHEGRAATCTNAQWVERSCPVGCAGGLCVDCLDGQRGCASADEAQVCEAGQWRRVACVDAHCMEGSCRCQTGAARCTIRGGRQTCDAAGVWQNASCPSDRPICFELGACGVCRPGEARCLGPQVSEVCQPDGTRRSAACHDGCDAASGRCQEVCVEGERRCSGAQWVEACADDRRSFSIVEACDVEGTSGGDAEQCTEGVCVGVCATAAASLAPAGCRFHATPTDLIHMSDSIPAVSDGPVTSFHVVNPDATFAARGRVWLGLDELAAFEIAPGQSARVDVPGRSVFARHSHRLREAVVEIASHRPVFVVQHLDLHERVGFAGEDSMSGDTAFLLPDPLVTGYGQRYRALTQPLCSTHDGGHLRPGGFTIVPIEREPTRVGLTLFGSTWPGPSGDPPPLSEDRAASQTFVLEPGEVLHLRGSEGDLTGTLIEADPPVAVFNGGVSRVPCAAGHVQTQLLEQLMPVGLWGEGTEQPQVHLGVGRRIPRGQTALVGEQWVFVTDQPDNVVDLRIDQTSFSHTLGNPGASFTITTQDVGVSDDYSFRFDSTRPVLVARYLHVHMGGGSTFALERPRRFWRARYHIVSPGGGQNRLLMLVPQGNPVELDGALVTSERRPGPEDYERLEIDVAAGPHAIRAPNPFGLLVYGFALDEQRLTPWDAYSYTGPVGFGDGF